MDDAGLTCDLLEPPRMGKKKAIPKPEPERRLTALAIKGSAEWRAWVQEAAEFCRTDTSKLVDAAILEYARKRGFTKEPPKR
jgi:hypothetical protein